METATDLGIAHNIPTKMVILRFSVSIILLISKASIGSTLGPPSWQSDWTLLRSQAGQSSLLELHHSLNELPIKGKALVRLLSGSNAGFSFEAIGSAQWDDDDPVIYCGVVFMYSSTHARLGTPTSNNAGDTGRIFCAGQQGWSDAGSNSQAEQEAEVKVLLWLQDSFLTPDINTGWTHVDCFDPNLVFFEFPNPTGETLALVQVQVRVVDMDGVTWITEGIATDNSMSGLPRQQGGVIYSHDNTSIRLWIRKIPVDIAGWYSVGMAEDGWSFKQVTNAKIVARTGDIRVYAWKTLGEPLFSHAMEVDLDAAGELPGDVILNTKVWDPVESFITLKVIPLDGDNEGYVFYGTGVMPRAEYNNYPYGGVHFGYSQSSVRLFYPVGPYGCMMRIGSDYGGGMYQQCCRRARIQVTIWGESHLRPEKQQLISMHCHLTQHKMIGLKRSPRPCVLRCIVQPDCVALMVDQSSGACTFLNSEEANRELDNYNPNQYAVLYAKKCSKHQ